MKLKKVVALFLIFSLCFSFFVAYPFQEAQANPVAVVAPGVIAALGTALVYAGFEFSDTEAIQACAIDLYRNMDANLKAMWENTARQLEEHGQANTYLGSGFVQSVRNWYDNHFDASIPIEYNSASGTFDFDHWSTLDYTSEYHPVFSPGVTDKAVCFEGDLRALYGSIHFGSFIFKVSGHPYGGSYRLTCWDSETNKTYVIRDYQLDTEFLNCSIMQSQNGEVLTFYANGAVIVQRNVSSRELWRCYAQYARGSFFSLQEETLSAENMEVNLELYEYMNRLVNVQLQMQDSILQLQSLVNATPASLASTGAVVESPAVSIPDVLNPPLPEVYPENPEVAVGTTGWLSSISDWCGSIWNSITSGFQATWQAITNVGLQVSSISTAVTSGLVGNVADINVSGLQNLGLAVSDRFPFCLPWDVKNAISSLSYSEEIPVFDVAIPALMPGSSPVVVGITIPEEFRFIIDFIRGALLFIFTLGLVLLTSRFLGGDG